MLVSDSLSESVDVAKTNIANKGEPNLNDTAPTYMYVEELTENVENPYSITGYKFNFSKTYEFDEKTGTFKLTGTITTDYLSDNYIGYWTGGGTNMGNSGLSNIYYVKAVDVSTTNHKITKADKRTYKIASSIRSEVGLYKTEDDYGDVYYYRGDVQNNNVYFGGFYWKIIRTNGDGSLRLIYNGKTANATGNNTAINNATYPYSAKYPDPTYVGYMYGKNFEQQISDETVYYSIAVATKYYFADDYEFDESSESYKLKGSMKQGTFSEMKDEFEIYPYTCKSTTSTASCQFLIKVNSLVTESSANVQYYSYSSTNLDDTRTNEVSSNAKAQLDKWYKTNIVDKMNNDKNLLTNYIIDGTFCNDRGITDITYNSGYKLGKQTIYSAYTRLYQTTNKTATLKCSSDIRDKFSATSIYGNAKLAYPVALITADEMALAGGRYASKNENYYLHTNGYFATMTPCYFPTSDVASHISRVNPDGSLDVNWVTTWLGLRPVINIHSDVLISSGDGTVDSPYQLTLS